jgi:hypothetical protein
MFQPDVPKFCTLPIMVKFNAKVLKFEKKGEKSGWTYIEIPATQANKLKPGTKVSFRVKGTLDSFAFEKLALLPMGEGSFILPLNATLRKGTGKKLGDTITVVMEPDDRALQLSADLLKCLKDDPVAMRYFKSLAPSHQAYFSKWIESAKTNATKTKRIVLTLTACAKKQSYSEMIRASREFER